VVVSNGVVGTPVGYGTANVASTLVQRDANGNFSAGTITANVTGNVTGSVTGGVSGNAGTATKLATARTINVSGDVTGTAQSFDGSANITIPTAITAGSIVNADINSAANISDTKLATISTANKVSNSATTATSANTAFAIVARDANGNFSANQITANLTGNASTASSAAKLTTARTINGVSFDGSSNITIGAAPTAHYHDASDITGGTLANARLPARLQATAQTITDWNNALENGWYQGNQAANAPEGVLDWWLGYVEAHYDRWVTQTVHRFTADAPINTHIWRRSSADAGAAVRTWGPWYKLQLSQAEQDARYSLGTHTHTAATTTVAGFMSAADKAKLDGATSADTANAIVARDSSGGFAAGTVLSTPVLYTSNQDGAYLIAGANGWTGATTNWGTYGFQHKIKSNSGGVPRLTIDDNFGELFTIEARNVGIGAAPSPSAKLNVGGTIAATTIRCNRLENAESNDVIVIEPSDDSIRFISNDTERMRVTSGGDVGIGTTTPTAPLTCLVNNPTDDSTARVAVLGLSNVNMGQLEFRSGRDDNAFTNRYSSIQAWSNSLASARDLILEPEGGDVRIGAVSASAAGTPLITGANGAIRAGAFGTTAGTFCQGNDPRLSAGATPAGAVMAFAMNAVPTGWLAANGAAVSRAVYATLFAAIGTTHGSGDGSTTFNLPNLQGIFVRGSGVQTVNGFTYNGGNVGGKQNDQFQEHNHEHTDYYRSTAVSITVGAASNFGTGGGKYGLTSHSWSYSDTGAFLSPNSTTGGANAIVWNGTAWVARTPNNAGPETRPANISLLYCIKF
jgi:microcystin-dependent protein